MDPSRPELAFARVELLAVLFGIALLGTFALPMLGTVRSQSDRVACLNNLRQMGRAAMLWAGDHGDRLPWHTPVAEGGLFPSSGTRPGNAWFEYMFMSNELATPRILACPADAGVLVARDFSEFVQFPFRANAVSYAINVHTTVETVGAPLFMDRNIRVSAASSPCFVRMNSLYLIDPNDSNVGWTNAVHGFEGNDVGIDGAVRTTTSDGLREALRLSDNNGTVHLLRGR